VVGVRTFAGVLAGESRPYADEVEGCYGIRPTFTDESVFAAAHERLDALLPGRGSLLDRHLRWRDTTLVPPDQIEGAMVGIIQEARARTNELVELPAGEGIVVEAVHDEPWQAYHYYQGNLRGRIAVNVDIPMSATELLHLTMHETYPGHQAERALKDDRLVRGQGLVEEALVLGPTPQSLVSEGLAEIGPEIMLDRLGFAAVDLGVDIAQARAIDQAMEVCRWVQVNAALMLHEHGASEEETEAYAVRWGLVTPELASHLIRFITEPTSRNYIITYPGGRDLCRAYVGGDPERFRRLLTEQVRVRDLTSGHAP
jgi:hypothetical protein